MELIYINSIMFASIFFLNYFFRYRISKFLNIIDKPDKKKKIHKNEVPLNGGIWFFFLIVFFVIEDLIFVDVLNDNISTIILASFLMFILGLKDDNKPINPNLRLFFYFIIFFIICESNNLFKLEVVYFESIDLKIYTYFLSSLFSAFCLTAFVNSINLVDGINALANTILAIILSFLYFIFLEKHLIIGFLIILLFLNSIIIYKGLYFLGDSGSIGISTFVGMYIIYIYNSSIETNPNLFFAEDIFILMAFPGFDMIRVFFSRLLNKQNPFIGGRNHLHHFLIKKHSLKITLFIYLFFAFIPSISNFVLKNYASWNLLLSLILYFVLLKYSTHSKIHT